MLFEFLKTIQCLGNFGNIIYEKQIRHSPASKCLECMQQITKQTEDSLLRYKFTAGRNTMRNIILFEELNTHSLSNLPLSIYICLPEYRQGMEKKKRLS